MYAAYNYELCHLLKVTNVIAKTDLRLNVASWIAYTIMWNITRDGSYLDSFLVPVGHTATAVARNFMWTDEDNVIAFVEQRADKEQCCTSDLIKSMNFYCDGRDQIVSGSIIDSTNYRHVLSASKNGIRATRRNRCANIGAREVQRRFKRDMKRISYGRVTSVVTTLDSNRFWIPGHSEAEQQPNLQHVFHLCNNQHTHAISEECAYFYYSHKY